MTKYEDLTGKEIKEIMLKEIQRSKLIKKYNDEEICDEICICMPEFLLERYLNENFEEAYDRARYRYHIIGIRIFPFLEMTTKMCCCDYEKLKKEKFLMVIFTTKNGEVKEKEVIKID